MATLKVLNGDGTAVYLEVTGAGTSGDPYIPYNKLVDNTDAEVANYGALVTRSSDHQKIHDGDAYQFNKKFSALGAGATTKFLIRTHASTKPHLRLLDIIGDGGPIDVEVFEGATVSAVGTSETIYNKNRSSANTPDTLLYSGTTTSASGTSIDYIMLPTAGNKSGTSDGGLDNEWILDTSTDYIIAVTNNDSSAIDYEFSIFFYE